MKFNQIYVPITATPFRKNVSHVEYEPCEELKPYIRCYWGSEKLYTMKKTEVPDKDLIVPDTCMDVMFYINYTDNKIESRFSGINDSPFSMEEIRDRDMEMSIFAIRFYPWSVVMFSEDSMRQVKNILCSAEDYFSSLKKHMEPQLLEVLSMKERITVVEKFLINHIHLERQNSIFMEAVEKILFKRGNIKVLDLEKEIHTSGRQLERIFNENMGLSPKQFSSMVRYQNLWRDIVCNRNLNIQDEVYNLGFTDQAHLLRTFKKYHTMTPAQAREYAVKDVGFLQEPSLDRL